VDGCQQTTVSRPDGSKDVTVFALNNGAWPTTITSYDTDGATVLSTVTNAWDFSNPCTLAACDSGGATQEFGAQYIRRTDTWTTLPVPGGNITNRTTYAFDSPQTGNVTGVLEWAFRNGTQATASFPTVPDRATYTTYTSIGTNNNINKPTSITECNNVGASDSNCAIGGKIVGGTAVSRTTIAYDTYGATNSSGQQVVLPLQNVSGAVNHDDTNFGLSYTARGNPTQISRWVSGSTYLTTYVSYDTTGQRVQVVDSNLNTTTYLYADHFYYDNGGDPYNSVGSGPPGYSPPKTNAYVTSVTDTVGTTSTGYYYGSGKIALATDYNGVTKYSHYMDPFDRKTATDLPIGWTVDSYAAPPNSSATRYRAIGDTTPSSTCVSCTVTTTKFDSLGREASAFSSNIPAGQTQVMGTFDGLNRIATLTHPNFGSNDPNDVVETPHYDGLGRSLGVTHPDGQATKTAYGAAVAALGGLSAPKSSAYGVGFPVLSVDEQGNLRQKWLDGFGRLIEVDEPSGAGGLTSANYTNYAYDILDNLTSVSEGAQTRSYTYDGLSRPTQGTTPEGGQVKYSYFATATTPCSGVPANPCAKTDARQIVTTYTYDSANRLIGKSYNISSMPNVCTTTNGASARVCYSYGTSPAGYNIGHLLTMTDPSGSETYSYDRIGRITQLAKVVGSSTYTTKYAYNTGGQPVQITYPSGRNVYYTYDNAGHLCLVSSASNGSCTAAAFYLSVPSVKYDAAGRPLAAVYGNGVVATAVYSPQRSQLTNLSYGSTLSTTSSSVIEDGGICHNGCIPQRASFTVASTAGFQVNDTVTVSGDSNSAFDGTYTVYSIPSGTVIWLIGGGGEVGTTGSGGTLTDLDAVGTSLLALNYYYQVDSANCPKATTANNGQIQCINDMSTSVTGDAGRSVSYTYDFLGRLSGGSTTGSTQYPAWTVSETYDRYGNLSKQNGTNSPPIALSVSPANNQINTTGYQYDASGNLTTTPNPGGTSYVYDGEECLTVYTSAASNATYTCDGSGARVQKVVTGTNAVNTVYVRSGGRVIAEYDNGAAVTSPTREYLFGSNLLAIVWGSTGGSGGTMDYIHRDHLSPRMYTKASGGIDYEQGHYPFGELWYPTGSTSNQIFTTYERDAESGNDYAMARSYANGQARFLSPDPVEGDPSNPQSWNRYSYVGDDPINVTDPSGKFWLLDALEALVAIFSGDPALVGDALLDTGTDPSNYLVGLEIIPTWGTTAAGGASVLAGVSEAASLGAGSAGAGAFVWGGAGDPGGEMGGWGQALFKPEMSGYWGAAQGFVGEFAKGMVANAAGGIVGHVVGGVIQEAIEGYLGTGEALVPKGPLGYESGVASSAEDQLYLYRGVHAGHPALDAAMEGTVVPGDVNGTVTAAEHNIGGVSAESPYTSWTTNESVARANADKFGPGGVVLRVPAGAPPAGATWSWEWSPDLFGEDEVLLRGIRTGVEVLE